MLRAFLFAAKIDVKWTIIYPWILDYLLLLLLLLDKTTCLDRLTS